MSFFLDGARWSEFVSAGKNYPVQMYQGGIGLAIAVLGFEDGRRRGGIIAPAAPDQSRPAGDKMQIQA